ncbi:MAG: DUF1343 domain-containing protein [Bacteroidia bacterium]|nr:DUF1343 domain-containing protein [Bacteroidia bacterium]
MLINFLKNTVLLFVFVLISCGSNSKQEQDKNKDTLNLIHDDKPIVVGANQTENYLQLLNGKKVGIVANQTSVIFNSEGYTHLVDSLVSLKIDVTIDVTTVFSPEHGFRGKADAGEKVVDGLDTKTGIPIISLYGDNKKPKLKRLTEAKELNQDVEARVSKIDILVFDLQDVGARFYTYISTLHYAMEACAEANIPMLILDRPNPNGHYFDGPILEPEHKSFVGMHPVPIVHGMTIGEYAQMINGEKWLKNGIQCDITVIPVKNYTHETPYSLPIKPSPNLPNDVAIDLYPSLCFFEGTNVSVGRGTEKQFQIFGSPFLNNDMFPYTYEFKPMPNEGAKYPKHQGKLCYGMDLSQSKPLNRLDLNYLIEAYQATEKKEEFFNDFFTKLAGSKSLQKQIEDRHTAYEIKKNWVRGLQAYDAMRQTYMIYK